MDGWPASKRGSGQARPGVGRGVRVPIYLSKRDILEAKLTEAILRGELPTGKWLRQEELAARFGVSSTPVREALRVLESKGLVVYELQRGVRVADFAGSARQFFRLCEALESLATEMAVENMTPTGVAEIERALAEMEAAAERDDPIALRESHRALHLTLYRAASFPALVDSIQMAWSRFPWDGFLSMPEHRLLSLGDHRLMVESVTNGDSMHAVEHLRGHLRALGELLPDTLEAQVGESGYGSLAGDFDDGHLVS